MRLLLIAFALAAPSLAQTAVPVAPAPIDIVKLEQKLWTTMADGDFPAVRGMFTTDFIQVDDQIRAADNLLIKLKHCKLESYELRDLQVRILTPNSAMTAYHVVDTLDCGGTENPSPKSSDKNATTVWVRAPNSNRWLAQAHTETPAKAE